MRRRAAFSLIEITGALALLALVALIAVPSLRSVFSSSEDTSATTGLTSAQVQGRSVIVDTAYKFTDEFVAKLMARDTRFVIGPPSVSTVSVARADETAVVYTTLSKTGACVVMLDRVDTEQATFAIDSSGSSCIAGMVLGQLSSVSGTAKSPSTITL